MLLQQLNVEKEKYTNLQNKLSDGFFDIDFYIFIYFI
jgi:hypothetical protein